MSAWSCGPCRHAINFCFTKLIACLHGPHDHADMLYIQLGYVWFNNATGQTRSGKMLVSEDNVLFGIVFAMARFRLAYLTESNFFFYF